MNSLDWIVIDTETTGLIDPIYVLEIYGQRMRDWKPIGPPFHAYLNHNVRIPADSTAVHGITKKFIDDNGENPTDVYRQFSRYVNNAPIVAHNLNYDWDRCLIPECKRLSIKPPGRKGFCTVLLARRIFPETKSVKLGTLGKLFNLDMSNSHRASVDVENLVKLMSGEFRKRLQNAGIISFEQIRKFSTQTPIKTCHDLLAKDIATHIQFRCPNCSSNLKLPSMEIGNIGRCPVCKYQFKITRSLSA